MNRFFILLFMLSCFQMSLLAQNNEEIKAAALQMIALPDPTFTAAFTPDFNPKALADMGFEQPYESEALEFEMRDGIRIHAKKYAHDAQKTVLLLHGTLANSYTYNKMAGLLREHLQAEVIVIDLRGHGQSGGELGDISSPNQYAEDVEDVLIQLKAERAAHTLILAGHSMGGGIALRYAETMAKPLADAYLLFAPNMGNNAPTSSQELNLDNNFIKTHLARGLGIRMLNEIGVHTHDSLKVVFYNLPAQVPLKSYSYRSMQASFPIDYKKALRSIEQPLLVLVGSEDEAFIAAEYKPLISAYAKGDCVLIADETHNGIRHNQQAMEQLAKWAQLHLN